jgi:hypothetical protein
LALSKNQQSFAPTPLRLNYEHARAVDVTGQLRECIDVLENPDIIVSEVLESFHAVDRAFEQGVLRPEVLTARSEQHIERAVEPEWFYRGRDLTVNGGSCSFTCLSSNVEPIPGDEAGEKAMADGFDFVGITCNASARPVLGTVQSETDASAYPLLLRALVGLAEMAPVIQLERLRHQFFMGALPETPSFDLYLVTWYHDENADRTPVCQFTRDIAELVKRTILEQSDFPGVLNDVVCLRMNPERFDGRMHFDWRV